MIILRRRSEKENIIDVTSENGNKIHENLKRGIWEMKLPKMKPLKNDNFENENT